MNMGNVGLMSRRELIEDIGRNCHDVRIKNIKSAVQPREQFILDMIEHRTKNLEGELLPGIPNDITLDHVAPKLPWRTFHRLSSVSHGWNRAIQTHQVYDARVRKQSADTLVVMKLDSVKSGRSLTLYSLRDRSCYRLPPIPGIKEGLPWSCECTSLHGKLYDIGGFKDSFTRSFTGLKRICDLASAKAYVLDLVGQRQWKQCASMAEPRAHFGCGVINGKMYVFGGISSWIKPAYCGCEVYNPVADVWSSIAPMKSPGLFQGVRKVGEVFQVYAEYSYSNFSPWPPTRESVSSNFVECQIYDPPQSLGKYGSCKRNIN